MKTTFAISTLLAAASATSVQINATTSGINNPTGGYRILNTNLYSLTSFGDIEVSALRLVQDQPNAANVECRMYRDAAGAQIGSQPFSGATTALIGTNTKRVGSILCYGVKDLV